MRLLVADISLGMAALMADSWGAVVGLQLLFAAHLLAFAFLCSVFTSSMLGILAQMVCYTGQEITWEKAIV